MDSSFGKGYGKKRGHFNQKLNRGGKNKNPTEIKNGKVYKWWTKEKNRDDYIKKCLAYWKSQKLNMPNWDIIDEIEGPSKRYGFWMDQITTGNEYKFKDHSKALCDRIDSIGDKKILSQLKKDLAPARNLQDAQGFFDEGTGRFTFIDVQKTGKNGNVEEVYKKVASRLTELGGESSSSEDEEN